MCGGVGGSGRVAKWSGVEGGSTVKRDETVRLERGHCEQDEAYSGWLATQNPF